MKSTILMPVLIMIISCSESKETSNLPQSTVIVKSIDIDLKSSEDVNLLGSNEFPTNDISATYLVNGKIVQSLSPHDYPNNVLFVNKNQRVRVFLNDAPTEEFPITYIKWNKTETDTLKAHYKRTDNSIIIEKLWLFENNNWKEITAMPLIIRK